MMMRVTLLALALSDASTDQELIVGVDKAIRIPRSLIETVKIE